MSVLDNKIGAGAYSPAGLAALAFGPGTGISINAIEGLDDLPEVRASDLARTQDDGDFTGQDYLAPRRVTVTFLLWADTPTGLRALIEALRTATVPQATPQPLTLFDNARLVYVKPRRRSIPYDAEFYRRTTTAVIEFYAPDPRIYDATAGAATVALPPDSGGVTFPLVFAMGFGAVSVGGTAILSNAGSYPTRPVFTITAGAAGVINPRIENVTTGVVMDLQISLAAGDVLTIDTDARTILLNGTASRRSALSSAQWIELRPGPNQINFRANAYSATAQLAVAYRSAWT